MYPVSRLITLPAIFSALLSMTGCIINPGNSAHNSNYGNDIKSSLVYDLEKQNTYYAENQLRARGYNQVSRNGNLSLWHNYQNNICYQLEENGGQVKKIHLKSASDCNSLSANQFQSQGNGASQKAESACIARFGLFNFKQVTELNAINGNTWAMMIEGKNGHRAACSANINGSITNWIDI